jgi:hypothetical protein
LRGSVTPAIRRTQIDSGSMFVFHSLSNNLSSYTGIQMPKNEKYTCLNPSRPPPNTKRMYC